MTSSYLRLMFLWYPKPVPVQLFFVEPGMKVPICKLADQNISLAPDGVFSWVLFFKIRATFSCNLSRNNVALQVEIVCCAYYHLLAQQIFMLQKVEATNLLCKKVLICARNNLNLQCNIVAQKVLRKCCSYYWALRGQWAKLAWSAMLAQFAEILA